MAQNNLGVMYANGQGVPRDFAETFKWYSLAEMAADDARSGGGRAPAALVRFS